MFPYLCASYQDQGGEQDEEYETEEQVQAKILNAALEFVPQHGWTLEAMAVGAEVRCKQLTNALTLNSLDLISENGGS